MKYLWKCFGKHEKRSSILSNLCYTLLCIVVFCCELADRDETMMELMEKYHVRMRTVILLGDNYE